VRDNVFEDQDDAVHVSRILQVLQKLLEVLLLSLRHRAVSVVLVGVRIQVLGRNERSRRLRLLDHNSLRLLSCKADLWRSSLGRFQLLDFVLQLVNLVLHLCQLLLVDFDCSYHGFMLLFTEDSLHADLIDHQLELVAYLIHEGDLICPLALLPVLGKLRSDSNRELSGT